MYRGDILDEFILHLQPVTAMASCEYCGKSTGELAFECNYCGTSFCQTHRLPEAHDCTNISDARPPTSATDEADAFTDWSRGAESTDEIDLEELRERAKHENQPYSVVEVEETVGTTPEPDFDSSPDVAVDGSIASQDESVEDSSLDRDSISINRGVILIAAIVLLLIMIGIISL